MPPLAQIRDRVRAALIRDRRSPRARQIADAIAARINAGTPPARAFAEALPGLPAPEQIDLRRHDIMRTDRQAPPPSGRLLPPAARHAPRWRPRPTMPAGT